MIKTKKQLIPRYNWDYSVTDFLKAFKASFGKEKQFHTDTIKKTFGKGTILTTSGRTSLYAILKALDLPQGAKVGVPLFCCHVVFDAVRQAGLTPLFIDVNPHDCNLAADDLSTKIKSLSALIAVHMFGLPADMDLINKVANNIPVIEDCAQSLFSTYKKRQTGSLAHVSFFSFRSGKYISAGEGSAIVCQDPRLAGRINNVVEQFEPWHPLQMAFHCFAIFIKSKLYSRPWYGTIGYPAGMYLDKKLNLTAKSGFHYRKIARSDLNIISGRIHTFSEKIAAQRKNALYYLKSIKLNDVDLPLETSDRKSNYYQFALRFKHAFQRDQMADYLFECGIDTARYLDNIADIALGEYDYGGDCPVSESCAKTTLIIPHHYSLSDKDLQYISRCINQAGTRFYNGN